MPHCIFLQGIPCSGKSTWIKRLKGYKVISADVLREEHFGKRYKHNSKDEAYIWTLFYLIVSISVDKKLNIVIDNTNVKRVYINRVKQLLSPDYTIEIKRFDIPLWKAYLRNYLRYFKTGKWIPIKVMKKFYNDLKEFK